MRKQLRFSGAKVLIAIVWMVFITLSTGAFGSNYYYDWNGRKAVKADPPVFVDPTPGNITVDCPSEAPAPVTLTATDDNDPSFPKEISAVDSPSLASINSCAGGTITRTWTATDLDGMTTSVSQTIVILADTQGPVITLDPVADTVSCELSQPGAPTNPLRYDIWINSVRLGLASHALNSDCSGIDEITDDAPDFFTLTCETLNVTFTITDNCGVSTDWIATYTVMDTVAPVLAGIPADSIISCNDPLPEMPVVTATDNCFSSVVPVLSEVSSQVMDGSCQQYEYTITRTWVASDNCGNTATGVQLIHLVDDVAPNFTVPSDIIISCNEDPNDLNITGNVTGLNDNCAPADSVLLIYIDTETPGDCPNEKTIIRTWSARDKCSNVTGKIQSIMIVDDIAPSFTVPADITVDCDEANDLDITGRPMNVSDVCGSNPDTTFVDVIMAGMNPNEQVIRRTWRLTDACGNFTELDQEITVSDQTAPLVGVLPQNLTLPCGTETDINQSFLDWVNNRGGAQATDNCSDPGDLTWQAFNAGTNIPPSFTVNACPAPNGALIMQQVDFIVTDESGNSDTTTAVFTVIDNTPPSIQICSPDRIVPADPGQCSATVELIPPVIEENCAFSNTAVSLSGSAPITSSASPGQEGSTPVDPIQIDLAVGHPLPVNAAAAGTLVLTLNNADAEEPTEFFNLYTENGALVGVSAFTPAQCGQSTAMFTIPVATINQMALDGVITFLLEPNIPVGQDGKFAINAICDPAGSVTLDLTFDAKDIDGIVYEYRVNEDARVAVNPVGPATVLLDLGVHTITYFATDCGGNTDSCSYQVTVVDQEAPVAICPPDVVLAVAADSCSATFTLPLPVGATDNCAAFNTFSQTRPGDTTAARLTFTFDPNLTGYLADDKTFVFTGVSANAYDPVTLTLDLQGDFTGTLAEALIYGDDDVLLGSTSSGVANCGTPGQMTLNIPAATFNTWAADGTVNFRFEPKPVPVPPGAPGDGVNPCSPVTANGQSDTLSYVFATLAYSQSMPAYFAGGATTIPLTATTPPDFKPTHTFNLGETEVSYVMSDVAGNLDTCSFTVTVEDTTPPVARCKPLGGLPINPSGLQVEVFDVSDVDNGSTDNCSIANMFLTPNTFTCGDAGTPVNLTLTVEDGSGNVHTCNTTLALTLQGPAPAANSGLCGGDTLYLFANPPAPGSAAYTYKWRRASNPGSVFSTLENPIIPNIDPSYEDFYIVEITGIYNNSCSAEASLFVEINDLAIQPVVTSAPVVCTDEPIVLNFQGNIPNANNLMFHWYQGISPNGVLVGSTPGPSITIPGIHPAGQVTYYVTVSGDGCTSPPSLPVSVNRVVKPVAQVSFAEATLCAGETVMLGTPVTGQGLTYEWTGPDGFSSAQQFPVLGPVTAANAGYYYLRIIRNNGCYSNQDSILVNVKPKPATPTLLSNSPICSGASLILTTPSNGFSSYQWLKQGGNPVTTGIPSFTINNANTVNSGVWQLSVTQNGCTSDLSAPVNVTVNPTPVAGAAAAPASVCIGGALQLIGSSNLNNVSYRWTGPGIQPINTQSPVIPAADLVNDGLFTLRVTSQAGCVDTATVNVDVLPGITSVDISDDAPACLDGLTDIHLAATVLPADNGSYTYIWRKGNETLSNQSTLTLPNATAASSGNYMLEVKTAQGCSQISTYILDLKNRPNTPVEPFNPQNKTAFCVGEQIVLRTNDYSNQGANVEYYWVRTPGGNPVLTTTREFVIPSAGISDGGQYSVYVVVDGCASAPSTNANIQVGAIPSVAALSNSPVCRGEMIQFEATSGQGATFAWGGPNSFSSALQTPARNSSLQSAEFGIYHVVATVNGCKSDTAYVEVRVKPRPAKPVAFAEPALCISSDNAVLFLGVDTVSATNNATYSWYLNSTGSPALGPPTPDLVFPMTNFSGINNGTYPFFVVANLEGCASEPSAPLNVALNTIPGNLPFAGRDTSTCFDQIMLSAAAPSIGTGVWTQTGGPSGVFIANPDKALTPVQGLTMIDSAYTFRWTLSNGACIDYAFDEVSILVTRGELSNAGEDILACEGEVINLSGNPAMGVTAEGMWSQPPAQEILGVVIEDPGDPNTLLTGLEPDNLYTFTWTISSECGTESDFVFVTISDPNPDAGDDFIVCNSDKTTSLSAAEPTLGSDGLWEVLTQGVIISEPAKHNTGVQNLQPGENRFVWSIDDGICGAGSKDTVVVFYKIPPDLETDVFNVGFQEAEEVDLLANDQVPPGSTVSILNGPLKGEISGTGNGIYVYTPGFNVVGSDQVVYEVASEGCVTALATATFLIGENAALEAPNIITPNGDGINDEFVVPGLLDPGAFPQSQVLIFNRWGDEVFRSNKPYQNNWDGRFSGEDLPADTYFYIIDLGNGEPAQTGFVVIQR